MFWIIGIAIVLIGFGVFYFLFYGDTPGLYKKALAQAENGNFAEARSLVRPILDRDPDNPRANFNMAQIYAIQGDDDHELSHLLEVKRINQYSKEIRESMVLNRIGEIYYEKEKFTESFEHYLYALRETPKNEEALVHLAFMAVGQGEFGMANEFFATLTEFVPKKSDYRVAYGISLSMIQNPQALDELEEGLELNPDNQTVRFLTALQAFRQGESERAKELVESLLHSLNDPSVAHIVNRLGTGVYFMEKDFKKALALAERCLATAVSQQWAREEYDARITIALLGFFANDLEKSGENLLELEFKNPQDDLVLRLSDFRWELEDGVVTLHSPAPDGFNIQTRMQSWLATRFPPDSVYNLSGLRMNQRFRIPGRSLPSGPADTEMIDRFNSSPLDEFKSICRKFIGSQGYKVEKEAPYEITDGADFIARTDDGSRRALFRFRRWSNQNISDIFLGNTQSDMAELGVGEGIVVTGAALTEGANASLKKLQNIRVINERELTETLQRL